MTRTIQITETTHSLLHGPGTRVVATIDLDSLDATVRHMLETDGRDRAYDAVADAAWDSPIMEGAARLRVPVVSESSATLAQWADYEWLFASGRDGLIRGDEDPQAEAASYVERLGIVRPVADADAIARAIQACIDYWGPREASPRYVDMGD